jgi:phosphatidylserine decarboxylase
MLDKPFLRPFQQGWKLLLPIAILSVALAKRFPRLAGAVMLLNGLIALTFRDPEREIQHDDQLALAPADGRVMRVETIWDDYWQREMLEVAIFLAIWDVHVQRVPVEGTVVGQVRKHGANRPAMTSAAAKLNNQLLTYYETESGPVTVNQITGMVARRLINWNQMGSQVQQGDRLGMIVLGSQVTLHVDPHSQPLVWPGDIVRAGVTPLVKFRRSVTDN